MRRIRHKRSDEGTGRGRGQRPGFTLLETITAIIILSIAVPPMLFAVRESHRQRVNPLFTSKACWLLTEKLEDIIADRQSTSGNRGYNYLVSSNYPAEAKGTISGYPQFSRSVSFTETKADLATAGGGYMKVTVTVGWTDGNGNARTLSIVTVVTDYDPV